MEGVELGAGDGAAILQSMKRTAILASWLLSLTAAFLIGRHTSERPFPIEELGSPEPSETSVGDRKPVSAVAVSGAGEAIKAAGSLSAAGRTYEAISLLERHLAIESFDAEALFILSDLRQMIGMVEEALDPLFAVLQFPPDAETADRARRRLNLLINAREQQLINADDLVGLVAYFQRLVRTEPGYDGHRLKLARWLLRSGGRGEIDAADRLIREAGTVGAAQAEIDALGREINLSRTELPIERLGSALYTNAMVSGRRRTVELRLLIDTGASMTGLDAARLETLGARRVSDRVRVHTANGVALLPVYLVSELRLGPVVIEDLEVLGFTELPHHADGLLGMDVLDRLPGSASVPVGRPGKPR